MSNFKFCLHRSLLIIIYFVHCALAVLDGQIAFQGQYPYHVLIVAKGDVCNGAVIHDGSYVVTAAVCVTDFLGHIISTPVTVTGGTVDINSDDPGVTVPVSKIYINQKFQEQYRSHIANIAVLELKYGLLDLNYPNIRRIAYKPFRLPQVLKAEVSGFGVHVLTSPPTVEDAYINGDSDGRLRHEFVDIVDKSTCDDELLARGIINDGTIFCGRMKPPSDGSKKGVCLDDEGAPLVNNGHLMGMLTLRASHCDESNHSAFYTNVTQYSKFIDKTLVYNPNTYDNEILWKDMPDEDEISNNELSDDHYDENNNYLSL